MKRFAFVLGALLLSSPLHAANYIESNAIPPQLLPAPPAEGSKAWQKDVEAIAALQKKADKAALARAGQEVKMAPELVTQALQPPPSRESNPKLFALLDRVSEDGKAINHAIKDHYNTRRPYIAAPKQVKALVLPHVNPAYPSGHTSGALLLAEVLAQIYPTQSESLRARAAEIADGRVLVGMHYPHDVEGGRVLAWLTLGALSQGEAFQRDLQSAREEAK